MSRKKFRIPMKGDAHPQAAPPERCAACDKPLGSDWVILADRSMIHMGGIWRDKCYRTINGFEQMGEEDC